MSERVSDRVLYGFPGNDLTHLHIDLNFPTVFEDFHDAVVVTAVSGPVERRRSRLIQAVERNPLLDAFAEEVELAAFGRLVQRKLDFVVGGFADRGGDVIRGNQTRSTATRPSPPTTVL